MRIRSAGKGQINGRVTVTLALRWVILDLGELPCLIEVSKLNPGPSGEDAERGRSTSRCRITLALVRARTGRHRGFIRTPPTKTGLLHWRARSADPETKRVLAVALEMTRRRRIKDFTRAFVRRLTGAHRSATGSSSPLRIAAAA